MRTLVLNAGSGTVTATTFLDADDGTVIRQDTAKLTHHKKPATIAIAGGPERPVHGDDRASQFAELLGRMDLDAVDAVAHRVVHGGRLRDHTVLDRDARTAIEDASQLAPLHNLPAIELIDLANERIESASHVVCLDTAFHSTIPDAAAAYGGPRSWWDRGFRRFGFHGISHEDASRRAAATLGRPVNELASITVHAGGGVSVAAVDGGRSVNTSMGLTPAEGPVMAARSGSVDPGLLIHLLRHDRLDVDELESLLMYRSGLLGLSGTSGSEPDLRAARHSDAAADFAIDVYVHSLQTAVGSMLSSLGRLDALVLTGDVLESDAELRQELCEPFGFAGVSVDPHVNGNWRPSDGDAQLSGPSSAASVIVVPADEESAMAKITRSLLDDQS